MNMPLPNISYLASIGAVTVPLPNKALPADQLKAIRVIKVQQRRKNNPAAYEKARKNWNRKQRARVKKWSPERKAKEAKRHATWAKKNREWLREYRNEWNKRRKQP